MDPPAIEVVGLAKRFENVVAVDDIDFTVARGGTTALLGANGAGKTTTLSILLGLLLPSAGRVTVLGEDVVRHRYRVLHRMNFASPYMEMPHRLSVAENLTVYGRLYGLRDVRRRIERLAGDLSFGHLLKRRTGSLSAGQKTRVALAKALLNEPELLLLDEPTVSLDPDSADLAREYIEQFRRRTGATILLASHNMAEVERLCDSVLMMRAGRIVDRGAPAELIARYGHRTLEDVFLDIARERAPAPGGAEGGR